MSTFTSQSGCHTSSWLLPSSSDRVCLLIIFPCRCLEAEKRSPALNSMMPEVLSESEKCRQLLAKYGPEALEATQITGLSGAETVSWW
ncbi:hypothetical protein GN956_G26727 [Arapaima gigas]